MTAEREPRNAEDAFIEAVNAPSSTGRGTAVPHFRDVEAIWAAIKPFVADREQAADEARRKPGTYRTEAGGIEVIVDLAESTSYVEDMWPDEVALIREQAAAEARRALDVDVLATALRKTYWTAYPKAGDDDWRSDAAFAADVYSRLIEESDQ